MAKQKPERSSKALPRGLARAVGQTLIVPVDRDSASGTIVMKIDSRGITGGAEHTIGVECATARLRHRLCELVFVQLDPFDDSKASRVVVVRYSPERSRERCEQNEPFRLDLEDQLRERRGVLGAFAMLATSVQPPSGQSGWSVIVEAEAEVIARVGDRAVMLFFSGSSIEMLNVAQGHGTHVTLLPRLEVTLSVFALADLLRAWKDLEAT